MREILFRGKRIDNGEWVEGGVVQGVVHELWRNSDRAYITVFPEFLSRLKLEEVDPNTVGQYTGLCDKNGKKIFEGDVCKIGNLIYMVEFKYSMWYFTILSNKVYCCPAFSSHCGEYCEIIGNIHDNPELYGLSNGSSLGIHSGKVDIALQAIEKAPTVDAVEVVRCRDCKNYKHNKYSGEDDVWCMRWSGWLPTEPDDFCSYGERRSE